jgi:hypothetical protein
MRAVFERARRLARIRVLGLRRDGEFTATRVCASRPPSMYASEFTSETSSSNLTVFSLRR